MSFLNLTILEFLAILLPIAAAITALYFYDRSRRRRTVSTLRFWPRRPDPPMVTRRRKLQQPWSLLLQLLALLLLLLAIADFRWGEQAGAVRRHVVILDTSAWMGAVTPDGRRLMDIAHRRALAYLAAVPTGEPVMLIRGDANPAPATPFTTDRRQLEEAVEASEPSWTSIDLDRAFETARGALALYGPAGAELGGQASVGEVAYIGGGRGGQSAAASKIPRLRWIEAGAEIEDRGVNELVARRLPDDPQRWEVRVEIFHSGEAEQEVETNFLFAGEILGTETLRLPARGTKDLTFRLRTPRAGRLEVRLGSSDGFALNDGAALDLPAYRRNRIDVYSSTSDGLRGLLGANPNLETRFRTPNEYSADEAARTAVFDGFVPSGKPRSNAVYIRPAGPGSPATIKRVAREQRITRWNAEHPVAFGLRTRDVVLERTAIFDPGPGDVTIAETEGGPVIIARVENGRKYVFFGFGLADSGLRNRPAAPLLFANTLAWIFPDSFRSSELRARSPGLIEIEVGEQAESNITVRSEENPDLPWSYRAGKVRFFASTPGSVLLRAPTVESRLALTLPEPAGEEWSPPKGVLRGVPPPAVGRAGAFVWWPWLAALAMGCLLVEWKLFGRATRGESVSSGEAARSAPLGLGLSDAGGVTAAGTTRAETREKEAVL